MPRTMFIIPADADVNDYLEMASEAASREIVVGIPPALADQIGDDELPMLYVEEDPEQPEPVEPPAPEADPIIGLRAELDWLISYVMTGEA